MRGQSRPSLNRLPRRRRPQNICVLSSLISPLVLLHFLKSIGISAEIIGDNQNCEHAKKRVERGSPKLYTVHPRHFCPPKDDICFR